MPIFWELSRVRLDLVRTTYNESNEVVEYTLSVARADQFKYKVYHQRGD